MRQRLTIREQSKLSVAGYVAKVTWPGFRWALVQSAKEATPFLWNLLVLPALPFMIVASAIYSRRKDRELVAKEAARRAAK